MAGVASLGKYLKTIESIPTVENQYMDFKKISDKRNDVFLSEKNYLRKLEQVSGNINQLESAFLNSFSSMCNLLNINTELHERPQYVIKSISDLKDAVSEYNATVEKVEKTGGLDKSLVDRFLSCSEKLYTIIMSCKNGPFSSSSLIEEVSAGRKQEIEKLQDEYIARKNKIREMLNFGDKEVNAHLEAINGHSVFNDGMLLPKQLEDDDSIKLGSATIKLSPEEYEFMGNIYPELPVYDNRLKVPFYIDVNHFGRSKKSNIFILYDYDDAVSNEHDVIAMAVHKIIISFLSGFPCDNLILKLADCTGGKSRFSRIKDYLSCALNEMNDPLLTSKMESNLLGDIADGSVAAENMASSERDTIHSNESRMIQQKAKGEKGTVESSLYVYFGVPFKERQSFFERINSLFLLPDDTDASGVHNVICVSVKDYNDAMKAAKSESGKSDEQKAAVWLEMIDNIKKKSLCFEFTKDGTAKLMTDDNRDINVIFADNNDSSPRDFFGNIENQVFMSIATRNKDDYVPFIDIDDYEIFRSGGAFKFGVNQSKKEDIYSESNENIAVIFADDTFNSDDQARIVSTCLLSRISKLRPGAARVIPVSNQRISNVINIINGLEEESEGQYYSLVDIDKTISENQIVENLNETIRHTTKLMAKKSSASDKKDYSFLDLVSEVPTQHVNVIYDEFDEINSSPYGDHFTKFYDLLKRSKDNRCGVQAVFSVKTKEYSKWVASFTQKNLFDKVIVAIRGVFYDAEHNKIQLCVIDRKEAAQTVSSSLLNDYITKSIESPSYETIGFGKENVADEAVKGTIDVPIGKMDGETFSLSFDTTGTGIIGYMLQGASGSGKSSLLFSLILNGAMKYSPKTLQFCLLDFKDGTSFDMFRNTHSPIPHVRQLSIQNDADDADAIIRGLNDEYLQRSKLFKANGVKDIASYNEMITRKGGNDYLPRIIIIIDECQNAFYTTDASGMSGFNDNLVNRFNSLTKVGRAYGIHFVIATQKIDTRLAERIGSQLKGRCSFKMNSSEDAQAILSRQAASQNNSLPRRGTMIYEVAGDERDGAVNQVMVAHHYEKLSDYAAKIASKYPGCGRTFEIGNDDPLIMSPKQLPPASITQTDAGISMALPFAQNCVKDSTLSVPFSQRENEGLFIVGEKEKLSQNILMTLLYGAASVPSANVKLTLYSYLLNTELVKKTVDFLGNKVGITNDSDSLLADVYYEILDRDQKNRNAAVGVTVEHAPWIVVFDGIRKELFENGSSTVTAPRKTDSGLNRTGAGLSLPGLSDLQLSLPGNEGGSLNENLSSRESRPLPDKQQLWQTITEKAGEVGIFIVVNIPDPRVATRNIDYFSKMKQLITLPSQALRDSVSQRKGFTVPMEATLGSKNVIFGSKISLRNACYYITDSVYEDFDDADDESANGPQIYKIKPFVLT